MKTFELKKYFEEISLEVKENKDELVKLDQAFGDGDLGVTMVSGFNSVLKLFDGAVEEDFGKFFLSVSKTFNENAPSSLGTIISFVFFGMAKNLKSKTDVEFKDIAEALSCGLDHLKTRVESKLGEKTILDGLVPAVEAFKDNSDDPVVATDKAARVSEEGAKATVDMKAVHGRAAYHNEKTIGHMDGGAKLASVVFKAIDKAVNNR